MGLFYIFSIDGDWAEYFLPKSSQAKRKPNKKTLLKLIRHEIKLAASINSRMLHFVHSSPVARDFFLQPEFISLWKYIESSGGSVGIHCHNEHLSSNSHYHDHEYVKSSITDLTEALRKKGLTPISYRGGYMAFCEKEIPVLEKNGLFLDFSCDPDRYLWHKDKLISDWRGSPDNYFRMSYKDHRKPGKSNVVEIPLGKAEGSSLYIEAVSLWNIWKCARALAKKEKETNRHIIVSVLSHTYCFSSIRERIKQYLGLAICKRFGKFISDKEALAIINNTEGVKNT